MKINPLTSIMKNPKISIITVVFNGERYLEKAIKSVINQDYNNIEYIIIDGGSKDKTIDIIKEYQSHFSYWVSEPDLGIYDAMNKGINKATGELVGLLNCDDWYEVNALQKVSKIWTENKYCDLVYGRTRVFEKDTVLRILPKKYKRPEWLVMQYTHPSCFFSLCFYKEFGLYDIDYKIASDYDLVLRFSKSGRISIGLNDILTNFRRGGVSTNSIFPPFLEVWKVLRSNNYSIFTSIFGVVGRFFLSIIGLLSRYIRKIINRFFLI